MQKVGLVPGPARVPAFNLRGSFHGEPCPRWLFPGSGQGRWPELGVCRPRLGIRVSVPQVHGCGEEYAWQTWAESGRNPTVRPKCLLRTDWGSEPWFFHLKNGVTIPALPLLWGDDPAGEGAGVGWGVGGGMWTGTALWWLQ